MPTIAAHLREFVRRRASDHCEYCTVAQSAAAFVRLQIEHVIARQHGGQTVASNLALACPHCNLHKGTNLTGLDPVTGELTRLFDPRVQRWSDHFARAGETIVGLTAVGRTTVRLLDMNAAEQSELRTTF